MTRETEAETDAADLVKLCDAAELAPGEGMTVHAGDRDVAVFNLDGEFHAIDDECTHEGGPLGQGMVFGETVSCPWHFAEFDIRTGESLDDIAPCGVETYRIVVRDGEVLAELS